MITLREIALQCPTCGTWFRSRAIGLEGRRTVHTTTDFHECVDGLEPVAFTVHQCTACGFAGEDADFADDVVGTESAAAPSGGTPFTTDGDVAASEKYEAAARIARRRGEAPLDIAALLLRAAWCCVAEQDSEAERYFRREAARTYERALAGYDAVPAGQRAEVTYLVGELWRRVGDVARARTWLERVAREVTDPVKQRWLVALAMQQRDEPREWLR